MDTLFLQLSGALLYLFDAEGRKGNVHPPHPFLVLAPDRLPISNQSESMLCGTECRLQIPNKICNHLKQLQISQDSTISLTGYEIQKYIKNRNVTQFVSDFYPLSASSSHLPNRRTEMLPIGPTHSPRRRILVLPPCARTRWCFCSPSPSPAACFFICHFALNQQIAEVPILDEPLEKLFEHVLYFLLVLSIGYQQAGDMAGSCHLLDFWQVEAFYFLILAFVLGTQCFNVIGIVGTAQFPDDFLRYVPTDIFAIV